MRLRTNDAQKGPSAWQIFMRIIDNDDFEEVHHIYVLLHTRPYELGIPDFQPAPKLAAMDVAGLQAVAMATDTIATLRLQPEHSCQDALDGLFNAVKTFAIGRNQMAWHFAVIPRDPEAPQYSLANVAQSNDPSVCEKLPEKELRTHL